jgi:cysteine synthase
MKNLLQAIGKTPMVKLEKILKNKNVNLYAKLEGQNPGGSVKDRTALYMIEQAEKRGELVPGKIILEASSGNMGISLAMIGAYKGYKVQIIMSECMSLERRLMIKAFGAEVILTDKHTGTEGAIVKANELRAKMPDLYWFADQFNNQDNMLAHYYHTATEILQEVPKVDFLIAGAGTSGTIMGIAKKFKEEMCSCKIIEAVPPQGYVLQGIQNIELDFCGSIYQPSLIDEKVHVSSEDACMMVRRVATSEGIFTGMSSGAALFAANNISERLACGNIIVIIPDRGEKYLSTGLYK